jgi:hypothetical protein
VPQDNSFTTTPFVVSEIHVDVVVSADLAGKSPPEMHPTPR